jgi:hypothetical protein
MLMILYLGTFVLALPLAVAAFVLGNFAVLAALCAYTVAACLTATLAVFLPRRWRHDPPRVATTSSRRASIS